MISFSSSLTYYLYSTSTDMRKGFHGLSGLVRNELKRDPIDGSVYIFINKRRNKMKLLIWDRNGFVIYYKSLEAGTFELPKEENSIISWSKLLLILEGIALKSIKQRKRYKRA